MMNQFPASFLWGASSSAFQIEGGWDEGGKGMTVADFNSFKLSDKQADTKVASDFYHHWKEDIDLMKELGLKAYRFSLSWARIIPDGDGEVNPEGIAFYNKVIDYLIEQGIRPLVTLYHFDLPYALVEKYNGWECRDCAYAFERYARVCFRAFGDRVKYWQVINEQNLMIRVNNRMNIYTNDEWEADRMRAQMDYHMFLAHALAVNACHELVEGGKIAPAVSSTCTYPLTNKPEDVWAARMNDWFKTNYCLEMHTNGEYPGYYMRYLEERNIVPKMEPGDAAILKSAKIDYIALNYYRTLCASYLPADAEHPAGSRVFRGNEVDFDQYGYCRDERNQNLKASEYGAQIDPMGLRIVLNEYYRRYHLPLIITENGLGMGDELTADGRVHDDYRIDYLRQHVQAIADAIGDGVEVMGYCPWSVMDLLSSHQGFRKRYGFIYVNRTDSDLKDLARIRSRSVLGLRRHTRLGLEAAAGAVVLVLLGAKGCLAAGITLPGVGYVDLGIAAPLLWEGLLVALAECARIADGMDGIVCGTSFAAMLGLMGVMTLLGWFPLGVLPAALAGSLMAFLLWNFPPAKLRLGSVGSLFLAGMLGCVPLCIGWPDLTLPLALPFWLEGGMVALQILVCKASRGRRQLFRSAPLHRWLELRGQSAEQIFYTFCVIAMLGVALTVQLAKIS